MNNFIDIFQRLDDPFNLYEPKEFDLVEAQKSAQEIMEKISQKLTIVFEKTDERLLQDCSFHSEFLIPQECLNVKASLVLRFSNFGNLVNISEDSLIKDELLIIIRQLLSNQNYIYVPTNILRNISDAKPSVGKNWQERFFDYM